MTKLAREEELKKKRGEEEYLLSQLGQESERKAAPLVQEHAKGEAKKEQIVIDKTHETLFELSKKKRSEYSRELLRVFWRFIEDEGLPPTVGVTAYFDKKGIVVGITGTDLTGAFKISGYPKFDTHAAKIMAVTVGNTVARMMGHFRTTDSGIELVDETELKLYVRPKDN